MVKGNFNMIFTTSYGKCIRTKSVGFPWVLGISRPHLLLHSWPLRHGPPPRPGGRPPPAPELLEGGRHHARPGPGVGLHVAAAQQLRPRVAGRRHHVGADLWLCPRSACDWTQASSLQPLAWSAPAADIYYL